MLESETIIQNRYRLLRKLGRGSFGEVWAAHDEVADVDVAVKIYVALDDRGIEEFREEFRNVSTLIHTNILRPEHYDVYGSRPFLVMPLCRGSVEGQAGGMSEPELWHFIRDVSSGLAYLHGHEILHRDIKPDNILINSDGDYVISDFGISTRMRSTMRRSSMRQNKDADISGTIAYMAPEMFTKSPSAVKATDIWALGATLYELMTGELLFFGQGGVVQLKGAELPELPEIYSKDLRDTVMSCLNMDTWFRPTASELSEYAASKLKGENPPQPWKDRLHHPSDPLPGPNKKRWINTVFFVLFTISVLLGIISIVQNERKERKLTEEERIEIARQDSLRRAEACLDSLREVRVQDSLAAAREPQDKVASTEALVREKAAEERARKEKQAEEKSKREAARQDSLRSVESHLDSLQEVRAQDSLRQARAYQDSLEAARVTTGVHNGHEWVDLGLSVLWATCNVGASSPSDYGGYYAWGETKTKSSYTEENSKTYNVDMPDISGNPKYDAATANWGDGWRMPTMAEFEELVDKCDWEWTRQGGHKGYRVTGPNGNSIFLPAAGWHPETLLYGVGGSGYYWGAAPPYGINWKACLLSFYKDGNLKVGFGQRSIGFSVRPVLDKTDVELEERRAKLENIKKSSLRGE